MTPRERHSYSVIAKLLQDPRLFRAARRARQHRCAASTDTVDDLPMVPSPGAARHRPIVQAFPAVTEPVARSLVGSGDEPV